MVRNFILMVLGVILAIKGIIFLAFPWKMKDWIELFLEKSDNLFRIWGIVLLIIALICILTSFIGKFIPII